LVQQWDGHETGGGKMQRWGGTVGRWWMREGASGGGDGNLHVHQSCRRRLMPPILYLKFSPTEMQTEICYFSCTEMRYKTRNFGVHFSAPEMLGFSRTFFLY
jgi:hypothetical protein